MSMVVAILFEFVTEFWIFDVVGNAIYKFCTVVFEDLLHF